MCQNWAGNRPMPLASVWFPSRPGTLWHLYCNDKAVLVHVYLGMYNDSYANTHCQTPNPCCMGDCSYFYTLYLCCLHCLWYRWVSVACPFWFKFHCFLFLVSDTKISDALSMDHFDGLVQEKCNSSVLAMELRLCRNNPTILCMRLANGSRCYIVTSSPIGWAHTQNDPWAFVTQHICLYVTVCWRKRPFASNNSVDLFLAWSSH